MRYAKARCYMSFDLYFYKKKESGLTEDQLATYLDKHLPNNNSQSAAQWKYENPATGVYFLIDWDTDGDTASLMGADSFTGFTDLNFSFSLNFFRPRFFGLESFPVIERIINDLDLYILNPQDETDPDNPQKFPKGYFQEQWIRQNDAVTLEQFEDLELEYLPLGKSNYLWWYQANRADLQESLAREIHVPGYFILKNHEDGQLYTACAWPQHIPMVLPPVDLLMVQKKMKRPFRAINASGLVAYNNIMEYLGPYFETFEHELPELKILRPQQAEKIGEEFNAIKLGKTLEGFGTGVAFDSFVNVRP
jgi:hypothetical protein